MLVPPYSLAPHAYVCVSDDYLFFLNIKRDRYTALPVADARLIGNDVLGWPVTPHSFGESADPERLTETIDVLKDGDLIVPTELGGKTAQPVFVPAPERSLMQPRLLGNRIVKKSSFRYMPTATYALLRARLTLKRHQLAGAIQRVERRNALHTNVPLDMQKAARLADSFSRLLPYLMTSRRACLFHSLVQSEFLALHGIYAHWVFGVRPNPFAAHCWLQKDSVVFNDTVEHVRTYTPILVA